MVLPVSKRFQVACIRSFYLIVDNGLVQMSRLHSPEGSAVNAEEYTWLALTLSS